MDNIYNTPIKSIRSKCIDCTCGSLKEIRLCPVIDCPLYPYRMGCRPDESTINSLKQFYEKKVEPSEGF